MIILSFKSKKDKEHLLEKAKKMEEYASMIVDCIEESQEYEEDYSDRNYRHYGYRRRMR